jgi:EAL and modified HD-GYP domain-containing signal transduction protein
VGQGIGFINVTENFILGKYPIPFPPEKLALEVLEDVKITPQLVDALGRLWSQGYVIALDDVTDIARVMPLLHVARIIKFDLPQINPDDLQPMIDYLRQLDVKLVAEKVETMAEFERCQKMGFDLFQGYFLYKPNVVRTQNIDSSKAVIIHAMSVINNPMTTFRELEDYISRDVSITYKLLRVVNSAYYGNRITIRTIGQAISMMGMERLGGWLTLLLITSSQHKPHELTVTAITRAKFCELLAQARHVDAQHSGIYFVVGLFSVLNAFMDLPLVKAIHGLPLSDEIVEALLFYKGDPGQVLKSVIAYERGDLNKILELNIAPETVVEVYVTTLKWVNVQMEVIKDVLENKGGP